MIAKDRIESGILTTTEFILHKLSSIAMDTVIQLPGESLMVQAPGPAWSCFANIQTVTACTSGYLQQVHLLQHNTGILGHCCKHVSSHIRVHLGMQGDGYHYSLFHYLIIFRSQVVNNFFIKCQMISQQFHTLCHRYFNTLGKQNAVGNQSETENSVGPNLQFLYKNYYQRCVYGLRTLYSFYLVCNF